MSSLTRITDTLRGSECNAFVDIDSISFDVSPRDTFQPIFDRVYSTSPPEKVDSLWLHELALVYITLALGALHNLELPPNDPIADEFFHLSKAALAKGQFLIHNTIAAVQTLVS